MRLNGFYASGIKMSSVCSVKMFFVEQMAPSEIILWAHFLMFLIPLLAKL
jgi:hypothetical protein